jgi:(heptosyl)LPS beta-1,4-glucosyltransferase
MKHPVSAVILARNEEMVIRQSIDAIKEWVDEIILMDMESTDTTAEIGRSCGAVVYKTELIHNCFIARTTGIKKAKNQWILLLDADEIVSNGLAEEIIQSINRDDADLLLLPRANFALSGFGPFESGFPEYQYRCFKKNSMKIDDYKGDVHESYQPKKGVTIKKLKARFPENCLYHITNPTLEFFVDKINRYSTSEAEEQYSINRNLSKLRIVLIGLNQFRIHYFVRKGYKDGWRGFWLSIVFVFYKFLVFGKLWEMHIHHGKYPTVGEARAMMCNYIADLNKK